MKSKNVMLGLMAIVFAVGSAFTSESLVTNDPAYVWIKRQNLDWECVNSGKTCSNDAEETQICQIEVVKDFGLGTELVNAHKNANCDVTTLKTDSEIPPQTFNPAGTNVEDARSNP
jgi:hypothetical protein